MARSITKITDPKKNIRKHQPSSSDTIATRQDIIDAITGLNEKDVINILERVGVGDKYFTCYRCGKVKKRSEFYKSFDPNCKTGVSRICKECADEIAHNVTEDDPDRKAPRKKDICYALEYLDKPYVDKLYDNATVYANQDSAKMDIWQYYISFINRFVNYQGMRWHDSDNLSTTFNSLTSDIKSTKRPLTEEELNYQEQADINRKDIIKFVGYDPFLSSPPEQRPRLYAMMVSYLDDETKEDPFKMQSIISIVKGQNDIEHLSDVISKLTTDDEGVVNNNVIITKLMDARNKTISSVNDMAKDNGISQKYNNNHSSAKQTLSGKLKEVTEKRMRESNVNAFDIGTVKGMQQVADITAEACAKQIGINEDTLREIGGYTRDLATKALKERDEYKERYRLLLVENNDMKDYLRSIGLMDDDGNLVDQDNSSNSCQSDSVNTEQKLQEKEVIDDGKPHAEE